MRRIAKVYTGMNTLHVQDCTSMLFGSSARAYVERKLCKTRRRLQAVNASAPAQLPEFDFASRIPSIVKE
eukprot:11243615-Prorocentrum_lima.AAC.1